MHQEETVLLLCSQLSDAVQLPSPVVEWRTLENREVLGASVSCRQKQRQCRLSPVRCSIIWVSLLCTALSCESLSCAPLCHVSLPPVHHSVMWDSLLCMALSGEILSGALLYHVGFSPVHGSIMWVSCALLYHVGLSPVHRSIIWVLRPQRLGEGVGSPGARYRWLCTIKNGH